MKYHEEPFHFFLLFLTFDIFNTVPFSESDLTSLSIDFAHSRVALKEMLVVPLPANLLTCGENDFNRFFQSILYFDYLLWHEYFKFWMESVLSLNPLGTCHLPIGTTSSPGEFSCLVHPFCTRLYASMVRRPGECSWGRPSAHPTCIASMPKPSVNEGESKATLGMKQCCFHIDHVQEGYSTGLLYRAKPIPWPSTGPPHSRTHEKTPGETARQCHSWKHHEETGQNKRQKIVWTWIDIDEPSDSGYKQQFQCMWIHFLQILSFWKHRKRPKFQYCVVLQSLGTWWMGRTLLSTKPFLPTKKDVFPTTSVGQNISLSFESRRSFLISVWRCESQLFFNLSLLS